MNRKDIKDILGDPYRLLSDSDKAEAEQIARTDPESAKDLNFARSFARFSSEDLVGEPPTRDAVFLVNLREQLDRSQVLLRGFSLTGFRTWITASAAAVLLIAGLYLGGGQGGSPATESWFAEQARDDILFSSDDIWYSGTDDLGLLDADLVAESLDLYDLPELWDYDEYSNLPITDQLLELSPESIEEVLNQLETISFFTHGGSSYDG